MDYAGGIDGRGVDVVGYGYAGDRVANLLLEANLRGPDYAGVGFALHDAHGSLAMVNLSERGGTAVHLLRIDGIYQGLSAGFAEGVGYLARDTFGFRIWHC